jgi:DNA-binding response OmpR family regulator
MPKKVLLIDDEEEMAEMVSMSLTAAGYEMATAITSQEGLEKAKAEKPDVILLDIMMPEMDGYEICRRLKNHEETKNIPVVFFTALCTPDLEGEVVQCGGCGCIVKPFEPKEIIEKIKAVIQ